VSSVEAQLNDMDDAHLQDTIQNSSSQSIKELAIRILNERKASNMANGGIVKFANNEDKVRDRYKDLVTGDYENDPSLAEQGINYIPSNLKDYWNSKAAQRNSNIDKYKDIQQKHGSVGKGKAIINDISESIANKAKNLYSENIAPGINSIGKQVFGEDYSSDIDQPQTVSTAAAPASAPAPAPAPASASASVNTTPTPNPQAITAAIPSTVPVTSKTQQPSPQPTSQGTPAAPQNQEDIISPLREDVKTAKTEADKSIAERIEEQNKLEEEYAGKDVGTEEYRKSLKEEKDNAPDEARRMMYMRLAEFGANWASTPGPALVAGMQALKQTLPSVITDKKEHKAAMHNLDKAIYEVNHAEYLEKKGKVKEAAQQRTNASNILMKSKETFVTGGLKLLEIQSKERQNKEDNAARIQQSQITASAYGGGYGESKLSAKQSVAYDKAVDNAEKDMESSPMTMSLPIEERMKKKNELIKHYIKNDPILKGFKFEDSGDNTGGGEQLKTKSGTPYTIISK